MAIVGRVVLGVLLLLSMHATPAVSRLGWVQPGADDNSNAPLHEGANHLHNRAIDFLSAGDIHGKKTITAKVRPIRGWQNATHMVDLQLGFANSIARAEYLQRRMHSSHGLQRGREAEEWELWSELDWMARGIVQHTVHGMEVAIGIPPQSTSTLVVDTGSSLVWVQCFPCTACYPQVGLLYDPQASSSYSRLSCEDSMCRNMLNTLILPVCVSDGCDYIATYADGNQASKGQMGADKWTFWVGDSEQLVSGCGTNQTGGSISGWDGILGLDRSSLSLVSQLGGAYSQCFLPNLTPIEVASATPMHFGAPEDIHWPSDLPPELISRMPIGLNPARPQFQYIYVPLVGITVNGDIVDIPQDALIMDGNGNGGTIMDTGTTFSLLHPVAFAALKASLLANRPSPVDSYLGYSPCWPANTPGVLPSIVLNFVGGDMILNDITAYHVGSGYTCLAMLPAPADTGVNIIGNWQITDRFMVFDVQNSQISHGGYDCSRLAI